MTSSGEAIRRTPKVATIDHRWTAPLGQKLNDQRILKQRCCRFREMGSKTSLKAWYVKRLPTVIFIRISNSGRPTVLTLGSWFVVWLLDNRPALHTVAYVGAWLINSQATNHEPCQKCRCKEFHIQTNQARGANTLQQKPSQFHQKADPVLVSKKRAPFGGPFSMLTLRAIPFPIWNPKKRTIFPPQNWGFFLLFFCSGYCTFAPEGLVNFYSHFQFWQAYSSDIGLLVCCLAA